MKVNDGQISDITNHS